MAYANTSWSTNGVTTYDVYDVTHGSIFYPPTAGAPHVIRSLNRTINSATTPNFRHLRVKPENAYIKYDSYLRDSEFTYVFNEFNWRAPPEVHPQTGLPGYWNNVKSTWKNACTGIEGAAGIEADDPTQKVVAKLQEQMRLGRADLGTTLAEAGKTADHVAKTATRIFNALRALKKFDLNGFAKELGTHTTARQRKRFSQRRRALLDTIPPATPRSFKRSKKGKLVPTGSNYDKVPESHYWNFMAQSWLEYSYAWKPLLGDVYNLAEATAEAALERGDAVRYLRAKSKNSRHVVTRSSAPDWRGWNWENESESEFAVSIKLAYKVDNGGASIPTAFGLDNPLTIAWELVPFSFVADWFLPVGTAISALSAYNGLSFSSGSKTLRKVTKVKRTVWGSAIPTTAVKSGSGSGGGVGEKSSFVMNRQILFTFPSYGFPEFKDPRSIKHGLSAVALLQSIFLKR